MFEGLFSRELAPYVKSIVGVDVSKPSVEIYNHLAEESGDKDKMSAVALDLEGTPGELGDKDKQFDVVTVRCFHCQQNGILITFSSLQWCTITSSTRRHTPRSSRPT